MKINREVKAIALFTISLLLAIGAAAFLDYTGKPWIAVAIVFLYILAVALWAMFDDIIGWVSTRGTRR